LENKTKPDDRSDNVDRIQNNIDNTISNYRETKDVINNVDGKQKQDLLEKNKRREQSIKNMREEIRDEAIDKKNGYR